MKIVILDNGNMMLTTLVGIEKEYAPAACRAIEEADVVIGVFSPSAPYLLKGADKVQLTSIENRSHSFQHDDMPVNTDTMIVTNVNDGAYGIHYANEALIITETQTPKAAIDAKQRALFPDRERK